MYGNRELFSDLDETIQGLGDTSKVSFKGKGNIPIKLKNGDHSYIVDLLCPSHKAELDQHRSTYGERL